jgi:hypothetical protein
MRMNRRFPGAPVLAAAAIAVSLFLAAAMVHAQAPGGQAKQAPQTAQAAAPIDLTGYWVSIIVDEWRFRVSPQKGDIPYLPLNPEARKIANAWDSDKDEAAGNQCKAYGAVGVMQRPGRLHITWDSPNTLKIDADAGAQTRLLHFDRPPAQLGAPSWQGYSSAQWQVAGRVLLDLGGVGFAPGGGGGRNQGPAPRGGTLKVVTTNMLPGYIRKNGVPHSEKAVLTEYFNRLAGAENDTYLAVTAIVEDPTYLTQPFVRTYNFKKQPDATGWSPTACSAR